MDGDSEPPYDRTLVCRQVNRVQYRPTEVELEPGVGEQPAFDQRCLVGGGVVEHEADVRLGRDFLVEVCRNFLNSIARWRERRRPITLPVVMSSAAYRLEVPWRL
jgi:hypothetical protein